MGRLLSTSVIRGLTKVFKKGKENSEAWAIFRDFDRDSSGHGGQYIYGYPLPDRSGRIPDILAKMADHPEFLLALLVDMRGSEYGPSFDMLRLAYGSSPQFASGPRDGGLRPIHNIFQDIERRLVRLKPKLNPLYGPFSQAKQWRRRHFGKSERVSRVLALPPVLATRYGADHDRFVRGDMKESV